jgi:hypothetical protein
MIIAREKSSQSQNSHILALRDEKNRQVCLISRRQEK